MSETITFEKFVKGIDDPAVLAFARTLDIEIMDMKQFFMVISANGQRAVDLETFVSGCIKLRGMARSMDLMALAYAHKEAVTDTHTFQMNCMEALHSIRREVDPHFVDDEASSTASL